MTDHATPASPTRGSSDPFMDPAAPELSADGDIDFARDTTLVVGKDASLTLGTESLIVLGEHSSSLPPAPLRRQPGIGQHRLETWSQADGLLCAQMTIFKRTERRRAARCAGPVRPPAPRCHWSCETTREDDGTDGAIQEAQTRAPFPSTTSYGLKSPPPSSQSPTPRPSQKPPSAQNPSHTPFPSTRDPHASGSPSSSIARTASRRSASARRYS